MYPTISPDRHVFRAELRRLLGFSDRHVDRLERAGTFPRRVRLGERKSAWLRSEVEAWLAEKLRVREAARPPDYPQEAA